MIRWLGEVYEKMLPEGFLKCGILTYSIKGNDFTTRFNYLTGGGLKESPCGKWLKAQKNAKIKNGIEK